MHLPTRLLCEALMGATSLGDLPKDDRPAIPRPSWQAHAACRGVGAHVFFEPRYRAQADALCASCAVAVVCHQSATSNNEHGVWAGLDAKQRRTAQRAAKAS